MNQFINFFSTIICFAPVVTYWFKAFNVTWLVAVIAASVLCLFVPSGIFQLSNRPKFYEALGIRFFKRFVQNGDLANRLSRRKNPDYKHIHNRSQALAYNSTINMYQRFHLFCLILFIITAILAFKNGFFVLAILIVGADIIYNILPILLQQYNKARVLKISK